MKILQFNFKDPEPQHWVEFYGETLGFHCEIKENGVLIELGYSTLLIEKANVKRTPIHLAFHIATGSILTTKNWLDSKVQWLERNSQRIVEFPDWNARSFFFLDSMGNILEGIERPDRPISTFQLGQEGFIGLAEVGLPTTHFEEVKANILQHGLGLYDEGNQDFAALGNYEGLLILVREGRPWFPTDILAKSTEFTLIYKDLRNEIHCAEFNEKGIVTS